MALKRRGRGRGVRGVLTQPHGCNIYVYPKGLHPLGGGGRGGQGLFTITLSVLIKKHSLIVPRGERSGSILEPLLTTQWFLNTKKLSIFKEWWCHI